MQHNRSGYYVQETNKLIYSIPYALYTFKEIIVYKANIERRYVSWRDSQKNLHHEEALLKSKIRRVRQVQYPG